MHVVERLTRIDDKTLLYRFTVDDPADVGPFVDRRDDLAGDR